MKVELEVQKKDWKEKAFSQRTQRTEYRGHREGRETGEIKEKAGC